MESLSLFIPYFLFAVSNSAWAFYFYKKQKEYDKNYSILEDLKAQAKERVQQASELYLGVKTVIDAEVASIKEQCFPENKDIICYESESFNFKIVVAKKLDRLEYIVNELTNVESNLRHIYNSILSKIPKEDRTGYYGKIIFKDNSRIAYEFIIYDFENYVIDVANLGSIIGAAKDISAQIIIYRYRKFFVPPQIITIDTPQIADKILWKAESYREKFMADREVR